MAIINITAFHSTVSLVQTTIETQQKVLISETPSAKNVEAQEEMNKVFSVYKKVIESSIANLDKQKSLLQQLLSPLSKGISSPYTNMNRHTLPVIKTEYKRLILDHQKYDQQIRILQGRIKELANLDQPTGISKEWWDQFGTSLGSSS